MQGQSPNNTRSIRVTSGVSDNMTNHGCKVNNISIGVDYGVYRAPGLMMPVLCMRKFLANVSFSASVIVLGNPNIQRADKRNTQSRGDLERIPYEFSEAFEEW